MFMNEQMIAPANEVSFKNFLFTNRKNRIILWLAAAAMVVQIAIFKYLYPYANFIHGDSFSYIQSAWMNLEISTYPIGYSRFLRLFSVFFKSDTSLFVFQYLFIQTSVLYLLFTIFYFYGPARVTQFILLSFMVLNPLFLHLANLVSSDCLFAGLSITWFTLLLWIIHRPGNKIIIWQAVVLFIAFTVRYNALIYPFIAGVAFWFSPLPLRIRIAGIAAGVLFCALFVGFTSYQYKKLSEHWQFSPFSGWLLTNNALYAYRYVDSAARKPVPKKFKAFDNMVRLFFDSTRDTKKFPVEKIEASTFYMWSPSMPMMKYQDSAFKKDTAADKLKKWATLGPFYKDYGYYIIRQYPWQFIKHFIWPNSNKYYAPPLEFLDKYNSGSEYVTQDAKAWFGYKTTKVKTRMKSNKIWVLSFYPIFSGIINIVMLLTLLFYVTLKGWQNNEVTKKGIFLGATVWLLNAGFTIYASSAALRFQSFPILLTAIFVALLVDWLWKLAMSTEVERRKPDIEHQTAVAGKALV
jgi:hypothetical protein